MNIHEFQAKEVFSRYGIPVPRGIVATSADEAKAAEKAAKVSGPKVGDKRGRSQLKSFKSGK